MVEATVGKVVGGDGVELTASVVEASRLGVDHCQRRSPAGEILVALQIPGELRFDLTEPALESAQLEDQRAEGLRVVVAGGPRELQRFVGQPLAIVQPAGHDRPHRVMLHRKQP